MLKHLTALLITIVTVAATALVATAAPASANPGSPGCVTRAEVIRVHKGMTMPVVHSIFGTRGWQTGSFGSGVTNRQYRPCRGSGVFFVGLTWSGQRLYAKVWS